MIRDQLLDLRVAVEQLTIEYDRRFQRGARREQLEELNVEIYMAIEELEDIAGTIREWHDENRYQQAYND